jgi:hypothetical protein
MARDMILLRASYNWPSAAAPRRRVRVGDDLVRLPELVEAARGVLAIVNAPNSNQTNHRPYF